MHEAELRPRPHDYKREANDVATVSTARNVAKQECAPQGASPRTEHAPRVLVVVASERTAMGARFEDLEPIRALALVPKPRFIDELP